MFQTQIGPTGTLKGFLRPETSQGNYNKVFDVEQNGKIPMMHSSRNYSKTLILLHPISRNLRKLQKIARVQSR